MHEFNHIAQSLEGNLPLIYTALSKHLFYFRLHISQFVFKQNKIPLNPFLLSDYFLLDTVERDTVRKANNTLVLRSDEIWVFGPISNGVLSEILLAQKAKKPVHYFRIEKSKEILPADLSNLEMEDEILEHKHLLV